MAKYTLDELKIELVDDPAKVGYAALSEAADTNALAAELNKKLVPVQTSIPCTEFIEILYKTGVFDALLDASLAGIKPVVREVEKIKLLKQLGIESIDLSHSETVKSLSAVGIPPDVMAQITERSTVLRSRAEMLWGEGTVVDELDVRRLMYSDTGGKRL